MWRVLVLLCVCVCVCVCVYQGLRYRWFVGLTPPSGQPLSPPLKSGAPQSLLWSAAVTTSAGEDLGECTRSAMISMPRMLVLNSKHPIAGLADRGWPWEFLVPQDCGFGNLGLRVSESQGLRFSCPKGYSLPGRVLQVDEVT